jgi:formylglycine-generating enzyme required for sulfatase activity
MGEQMSRFISGVLGLLASGVLATILATGVNSQSQPQPGRCIDVAIAHAAKRCITPGSGRVVWFKDCGSCPEMVIVPSGSMFASPALTGPTAGTKKVNFAKPFAVGRFAVTFAQWEACVTGGGCNSYSPPDQEWGRDNRPVINVNWNDAEAFVRWLSRKSGKPYRLLSGAEREYVARAGTTTLYWWGDAVSLDQGNIDLPLPARRMPGIDYSELGRIPHRTVPVDSYSPNPWGLFNVHGRGVLPECGTRVARGGSWIDFASEATSAARIGFGANSRNYAQGFRVARSVP